VQLVVVLAAGGCEVRGDVDLIVAQDAQGERAALEDEVARVTVVPNAYRDARRALGGLGNPRDGHPGGLASAPGAEYVDAVAQEAQGSFDGVAVVRVSVQHTSVVPIV
jgi:hypothetical protein